MCEFNQCAFQHDEMVKRARNYFEDLEMGDEERAEKMIQYF